MASNLSSPNITLRAALPADAMQISLLYQQVYNGQYSNPLMRDTRLLHNFLIDSTNMWILAEYEDRIVGSLVFETDSEHRLSHVFGAAVMPEFRGAKIIETAMAYAHETLMGAGGSVDVAYATTRTSTPAPQIITERMGYKKLGIFPNVHRAEEYETHCLTAIHNEAAMKLRFSQFRLHPAITNLYEIVRNECDLPALPHATAEDLELDNYQNSIELELITAEKYALHRFNAQKNSDLLDAHFYPFHCPNMVISSPCSSLEIFVYKASLDEYCTIIGIKKPRAFNFTDILERCVALLRKIGVRYVEILVRADKVKTMERVLQARFIPCAYFPAFQLNKNHRYDFVVLSRTFEILDFRNLKLAGNNQLFLEEYLEKLNEYFLQPQLFVPSGASVSAVLAHK